MSVTPEQRFRRWTRCSLLLAVLAFGYFVVADILMPLTPHSRLLHRVIPIAPEVSGRVVEVSVKNHQYVHAGDVLFVLDDSDYRTALHDAELSLQQTRDQNRELDASLAEARASLAQAEAAWRVASNDAHRYRSLGGVAVSRQEVDKAVGSEREYAAQIAQARARIHSLEIQRGLSGEANLHVRQARSAIHQAQLNLDRTRVRALESGYVSNLNLEPGDYASTSSPLLSLVSPRAQIYADFREKSLRHAGTGSDARVVFDALPGEVFNAQLVSAEAGIADGQILADGKLAATEASDRWVRDAQRQRVYLELEETLPVNLPSGARATVQILPLHHPLLRPLAWLQIHTVALLHYVY
jgi:multidrug resistance efflux pump